MLRNRLLWLFLPFLMACSAQDGDFLSKDEKHWLEQRAGSLDVLFGYEAPPNAFYDDDGDYVGLLVDFRHEIEGRLGIRFVDRNLPTWDALIEYARTGRDFVIVGIARTDDRATYLSFTDTFIKVPYVIVTRELSDITGMGDLVDRVVCTVTGYAVNDYIALHYSGFTVKNAVDNLAGLRAVSTGACDAMVINQMYASYLIDRQGITNLKIAGDSGYLNRLSAATSRKDPQLFHLLEKAVDQIDSARRKELYRAWVSAYFPGWARSTVLALTIASAMALGLFLVVWFRTLAQRRTSAVALLESERKYQDIVNHIPDVIYRTDLKGRVLFVGPSIESVFGYTQAEVVGRMSAQDFYVNPEERKDLLSELERHGIARNFVARLRHKDGSVRWASANVRYTKDSAGTIQGLEGIVRDITDLKEAEEKLRISEARFRGFADSAADWFWEMDSDLRFTYLTGRVEDVLGLSPAEFIGKTRQQGYKGHTELDSPAWRQHLARIAAHLAFSDYEVYWKRADGQHRYIGLSGNPLFDSDGAFLGYRGTGRDITERKLAEAELRESNLRFSQISSNMYGVFWIGEFVAPDGFKFLYVSPGFEHFWQLSVADLYRDPDIWFRCIEQTDRERVREAFRRFLRGEGEYNLEFTIVRPDDTRRVLEGNGNLIKDAKGKIIRAAGIVRDITQRKRAESALRESEEKYRLLFDGADVLVSVYDREGICLLMNRKVAALFNGEPKDFLGKSMIDLHGEPGAEYTRRIREAIDAGESRAYDDEVAFPDGSRWLLTRLHPVRDAEGRIYAAQIVSQDITGRVRAEQEAKHLQMLLGGIIDAMPSVVASVDPRCRIMQWNRQAETWSGCSRDAALGRPLFDLIPGLELQEEDITRAVSRGTRYRQSKVPWLKGEETRYIDIAVSPLTGEDMAGAAIRMDDMTEQVRIDEMVVQSEKMLSVGGLAAGMAHEINNPLAGILQNTQVIRSRLLEDLPANIKAAQNNGTSLSTIRGYIRARKLDEMMGAISESARRAARIVDNMLSFSRKGEGCKQPENLEQLLGRTLELASNDYSLKKQYDFRSIHIKREFAQPAPQVMCEAGKVQQVILNLLKNASQALVEVQRPDFTPRLILRVYAEGDQGVFEVEDNGPGIPDEVRRRIFEPFFTTKEVGVGTGLGLSVSYFIVVQDHKGSMTVDSNPGRGACFTMKLPLAEEPAAVP